jgi:tetratricopeptide (TPR) repeat protein
VSGRPGSYTTAEIARMLELPRRRVRDLARSGIVSPERGPRNEYRFSFADLVVLRTARDLLAAGVPFLRVRRALRHLREQLPADRPLTGLRILANGRRVIVQEGLEQRDAETDQILLDFRIEELVAMAAPMSTPDFDSDRIDEAGMSAQDWYELACELETFSLENALEAYGATLQLDPDHADAHINLGRLRHEQGELARAEEHYRTALAVRPHDVTALYNLGVALEDQSRLREARNAYREVLLGDPDHADAHFNLAGVLERTGRKSEAVRHLKAYRDLVNRTRRDRDDRKP